MTTPSPFWTPHDYQKRAIKLLLEQMSGGLFLDPGLGKTSIILATFKILKQKGYANKLLVVAPLRVMYKTWPDEIKKWADFQHFTVAILHGKHKEWNADCDADIYLINPEGLLWLFSPKTKRAVFDCLCVDQSTKFKDSTTKRFRILKPLIPLFKRRWILTGGTNPNGIQDLFGQIYILDLGRALGRFITHFRNDFMENKGYGLYPDWRPRPGAYERVIDRVGPLVLQLSAEDYIKMPELVSRTIYAELPDQAKKTYQEVENDYFAQIESGLIVAANAAAAGTKCRQIANGAVYDEFKNVHDIHSEKVEALADLIEELNGKPALVMYEYEHDKDKILKVLKDVPVLGKLSHTQFDLTVDRFNRGEIPVVLGHPGSVSLGLNLQGTCHHIIWFGITWNLEFYDESIARIYRQGQESSHVYVYHIVAKGTLDEEVVRRLTAKDRDQQNFLHGLAEYRRKQDV
jgi:SNF2 family DNA or RNA helicase